MPIKITKTRSGKFRVKNPSTGTLFSKATTRSKAIKQRNKLGMVKRKAKK